MTQIIGIVLFFGLLKKLKSLFKDKQSTISILIGAAILRNIGLMDMLGDSSIIELVSGLLDGAIIMSVYTLITGNYYEGEIVKRETREDDQDSDGRKYLDEIRIPAAPLLEKPESSRRIARLPSQDAAIRKYAISAVQKYLKNRNYKVLESDNTNFDLLAIDNNDTEVWITIIAFEDKEKEAEVTFPPDRYAKMVELGRDHRLFIVTNCREDEDAIYLGNYVTVYYLDSPISEVGFKLQDGMYRNTVRKLKKYSFDQELSVRQEDMI